MSNINENGIREVVEPTIGEKIIHTINNSVSGDAIGNVVILLINEHMAIWATIALVLYGIKKMR